MYWPVIVDDYGDWFIEWRYPMTAWPVVFWQLVLCWRLLIRLLVNDDCVIGRWQPIDPVIIIIDHYWWPIIGLHWNWYCWWLILMTIDIIVDDDYCDYYNYSYYYWWYYYSIRLIIVVLFIDDSNCYYCCGIEGSIVTFIDDGIVLTNDDTDWWWRY